MGEVCPITSDTARGHVKKVFDEYIKFADPEAVRARREGEKGESLTPLTDDDSKIVETLEHLAPSYKAFMGKKEKDKADAGGAKRVRIAKEAQLTAQGHSVRAIAMGHLAMSRGKSAPAPRAEDEGAGGTADVGAGEDDLDSASSDGDKEEPTEQDAIATSVQASLAAVSARPQPESGPSSPAQPATPRSSGSGSGSRSRKASRGRSGMSEYESVFHTAMQAAGNPNLAATRAAGRPAVPSHFDIESQKSSEKELWKKKAADRMLRLQVDDDVYLDAIVNLDTPDFKTIADQQLLPDSLVGNCVKKMLHKKGTQQLPAFSL